MTTLAELAYWQQTILRGVGVLAAVLLPAGTIVYLYLFKMMSFMQSRLGPMEAGPYGSMQLFAEVGKWRRRVRLSDPRDRLSILRPSRRSIVAPVGADLVDLLRCNIRDINIATIVPKHRRGRCTEHELLAVRRP